MPLIWEGDYHSSPNYSARYNLYDVNGIPHTAFNGQEMVVGGGTNMYPHYLPVYQDFENDNAVMTIDLSVIENSNGGVDLTANVALESALSLPNNKIIFILTYNYSSSYFATVEGYYDEQFNLSNAGESGTFMHSFLLDGSWDIDNVKAVVMVQTFTSTGQDWDGSYGPYSKYPIHQAAISGLETDVWIAGDPNNDGTVNVLDVLLTVNHIVGIEPLTGPAFYAADVNDDGVVNVMDVVTIVQIILSPKYAFSGAQATMNGNVLTVSGDVGALQADEILLSGLKGQDQKVEANGTTVIFNLNGRLETEQFEFASETENIIVADSRGMEVEILKANGFQLLENYPDPFNPSTTISYQLPEGSFVNLTIYDMLGKPIAELVNSQQSAGFYNMTWDGNVLDGSEATSGIYFARLQAGEFKSTIKMLLTK